MARKWLLEEDPFAPIAYRYGVRGRLYSSRSAFQLIEVYDTDFFGRMLVLDNVVQLTERDEFLYHEMLAHVPLHAHPAPENVLVVGGGDGGTLREVLKHPSVTRAVLVELDPEVIAVSKRFFPALARSFDSPRVEVVNGDGAAFLRETDERFDAILVDSTDPVGPAQALSSPEFIQTAPGVLTESGLFAMQTESLHFHVEFVNRVQSSLGESFPSVRLYSVPVATYAGNWWTFSLASKQELGDRPLREPVVGLRFYSESVHRWSFVPSDALESMTRLGSGPYRS